MLTSAQTYLVLLATQECVERSATGVDNEDRIFEIKSDSSIVTNLPPTTLGVILGAIAMGEFDLLTITDVRETFSNPLLSFTADENGTMLYQFRVAD